MAGPAATLFDLNRVFTDADHVPLAGGKLYFYASGTATPQDTYTTSTLTGGTQNPNPIVLNASGFADDPIYGIAAAYTVNLTDANDAQIAGWPRDAWGIATPDF